MADRRIPLVGGRSVIPTREDLEVRFFSFFQRNRSFSGPNQPRGRKPPRPPKPTPSTPPALGGGKSKGRGGGAPPLSDLTTPFTRDFDADTTGVQPANTQMYAGTSAVTIVKSVEGHTKVLSIPNTESNLIYIDLGELFDVSNGLRIQYLMNQLDIQKENHECSLSSSYTHWGEGSTEAGATSAWVDSSQGNNPDTMACRIFDGTSYATGDINLGIEGSDHAWFYHRWEIDPNGNFEKWTYNTSGILRSLSNQSNAYPGGTLGPIRYVGFRSFGGWYGQELAEFWIADISVAWPTPGVPTT